MFKNYKGILVVYRIEANTVDKEEIEEHYIAIAKATTTTTLYIVII